MSTDMSTERLVGLEVWLHTDRASRALPVRPASGRAPRPVKRTWRLYALCRSGAETEPEIPKDTFLLRTSKNEAVCQMVLANVLGDDPSRVLGLIEDDEDLAKKVSLQPQTFVVRGAATKMMRRLIHEQLGGKDGWSPCYDGDLTLDNLDGRATVTPFGKGVPDVESEPVAEPTAGVNYAEADDDFRRRRQLRRAAKRHNVEVDLKRRDLGAEGLVHLRAHHPSTAGMLSGVTADGTCHEDCPACPTAASKARTAGRLATPCHWSGEVVTNNTMYASVLTDKRVAEHHVIWRYGSADIGVSEPSEGAKP